MLRAKDDGKPKASPTSTTRRTTENDMSAPSLRRTDMAMTDEEMRQALSRGFAGRLATVNEDGSPYCVPMLHIWSGDRVFVHGTNVRGHLQSNVVREPRVCFELDEPDAVFDYGRFECDSGLAYRSVILSGKMFVAEDAAIKQWFCERLMEKYGKPNSIRPKNFFPRLDIITVYAMIVERMTGKQRLLPALSEQWPAIDRTKTPHARPDMVGLSPSRPE
jgi:nitroimidazol reductase NimA-like FMN-containing flavoprotein (pyridoxamine 5'-phosphate oxidase superfamily)